MTSMAASTITWLRLSARPTGSKGRKYGFTFDQLGPRVPAIVVSPLIPRNLIDHRRYEHSTVVSTLIRLFDLKELTVRSSFDLGPEAPCHARCASDRRSHDAAGSDGWACASPASSRRHSKRPRPNNQTRPLMTIRRAGWRRPIASGLAQHLEVTPPSEHEAIIARVDALQTRGEALEYLKEVYVLVKAARQRAGVRRSASVLMHQ